MPIIEGNPYFKSCEEIISTGGGTAYTVQGRRDYARKFRVVVKDKEMGAVSVCLCPGLPVPGGPYLTTREYDLLALAIDFSAEREHADDPFVWIVTVKYSTELPPGGFPAIPGFANTPIGIGQGGSAGAANNPELEPPDASWDYEIVQEAPYVDLDGKAYVNPCLKPFKPAPTFPAYYNVYNLTRNETSYNADVASRYAGAVNSDEFAGCPPETVFCYPPVAKMMFRGTAIYWRVTYKLKFGYLIDDEKDEDYKRDPSGRLVGRRKMQPRILNSGAQYFEMFTPSGPNAVPDIRLVPFQDHGGNSTGLLTSTGGKLPKTARPTYTEFRQFRKYSFATLLNRGTSVSPGLV